MRRSRSLYRTTLGSGRVFAGDLHLAKRSEPESLAQSEFVLVRHSVKKSIWAKLKALATLKGMTLSDFLESHYEKIIQDEMKSAGLA